MYLSSRFWAVYPTPRSCGGLTHKWLIREVDCEEAAAVGSQGAGYEQKGPGPAVWGHPGLDTEGGNGEGDGRLTAAVVREGQATTAQGQIQSAPCENTHSASKANG